MDVDGKTISIAGLILAQIGFAWRGGQKFGVLKKTVADHGKWQEKHDDKHSLDRDRWGTAMERIDLKIEQIDARFETENGEPRMVTYRAFDKLQSKCQTFLLSEIEHVKISQGEQHELLKEMSGQVGKLSASVAVLVDRTG